MAESAARAPHSNSGPRLSYLPGLDGLRALAVSSVLLYHAGITWMPGGFLGVELFFVLSGYLITSLLLAEWLSGGKIDLGAFWLRRARRLLPALFLLLAVTLIFAIFFLPDEVAELRGDTLAASTYVTNWYMVFNQQSYFELVGRPSLLQHLWSLAVEEQFYLLWPLLFIGGMRLLQTRSAMRIATMAGAAASTLLMVALYNPDADPSRVYYGTDTRAAGLLIGCTLAFGMSLSRSPSRRAGKVQAPWVDLIGLGSLGTLLWLLVNLDEGQPFLYQGGFAAIALSTAGVIWAIANPNARVIPRILGLGILRWIGMRSYGIYLWHWPVFMVTRPELDLALDGAPLLALRLGITVVLAAISYHFVETPIRSGSLGRYWRAVQEARGVQLIRLSARLGVASALSGALAVMLGTALVSARPPAPPDYLLELETIATVLPDTPLETPLPDITATPVVFIQPSPDVFTPSPTPFIPASPTLSSSTINPVEQTATQVAQSPVAITPTSTAIPAKPPIATYTATLTPPAPPTEIPATTMPIPTPGTFTGTVVAIGDSVMLSGAKVLKKSIPNIDLDASVSRQLPSGISALKARRDAGKLGDVVVIHLGSNGTFTARQFDQMMEVLAGVPRVIFVNVKVPRSWERTNNAAIAAGVQRYPNAILVDWKAASNGHSELFAKDGFHLTPKGAALYTSLIVDSLKK
ncbi:MAG TPA: acyltransferase family protein [Chloroflexia bacterium]|nr:acyltransferase family protein [Chloroflexia bacterium]